MNSDISKTPTAVVIAHPGHEVRVHRLLELTTPFVFILTDGSSRSGDSRLPATTHLLAGINAKSGCLYGNFTEREFYEAVLNQETQFFIRLVDKLAQAFREAGIERVVGDAAEGYNSTHDICRLLINAAVEILNRSQTSKISNFDFSVVGKPNDCPEALSNRSLWIHLDDDAYRRKIRAAEAYYPELLKEVKETYSGIGVGPWPEYLRDLGVEQSDLPPEPLDLFRIECLRPVNGAASYDDQFSAIPFYEKHGERRQEAGFYDRVIRYHEHLVPIAQALWCHAVGGC